MHIQEIKSNKQSKYDEIIEYLKQDNGYWLENDKWDMTEDFFIGHMPNRRERYLNFSNILNSNLKDELKYYFIFNSKEKVFSDVYLVVLSSTLKHLSIFLNKNYQYIKSFNYIDKHSFDLKFRNYLLENGFKLLKNNKINSRTMNSLPYVIDFFKEFYDIREEFEKDIWYAKNIKGAKVPASSLHDKLKFIYISDYYKDMVKRYFKTIITKRSWSHCLAMLTSINYFMKIFYSNGYADGFIKNLTRQDIEKYLYWVNNDYKNKNATYRSKFVSYIRMFLEYIQISQYDEAPKKEVPLLIFQSDFPKGEKLRDSIKRVKFIPEPILKQLDNNIMELDKPEYIPIYILLRETGWRGTDILNLRYHNCLEQIWNNKEKAYNYYLCGEITKTGIAQLKIPIRDKVAEMLEKVIKQAKELSTVENNPNKYLFNNYTGKLKGKPLSKDALLYNIKKLIKQKYIRDVNGNLYHFKMHSLRHTRAKEYVEQGMSISIIQQILGHTSLQMTVHYATVTENTLYEKWRSTEELDLFRVNTETHELQQVVLDSDDGESLIRYEYVKKNLDAVKVPFGVCFKPSKLPCKQQMNHCLTCASFCTTTENISEYEDEIEQVKKQIEISERCGRELWAEKNKGYLELLEKTLEKVKEQKLVHKNGQSRED